MGIDAIGSVITRGVLLDVFTSKKEQLVSQGAHVSNFPPAGFFYTSEDLEDAMVRQCLRITDFEPGDVIFVRTEMRINTGRKILRSRATTAWVSITIRRRLTIGRGSG